MSSNIESLVDLREWGYRRGEAYAYRLARARRLRYEARRRLRGGSLGAVREAQCMAECAEARKVINSSLRSMERWVRGGCGDWTKKASEQP